MCQQHRTLTTTDDNDCDNADVWCWDEGDGDTNLLLALETTQGNHHGTLIRCSIHSIKVRKQRQSEKMGFTSTTKTMNNDDVNEAPVSAKDDRNSGNPIAQSNKNLMLVSMACYYHQNTNSIGTATTNNDDGDINKIWQQQTTTAPRCYCLNMLNTF